MIDLRPDFLDTLKRLLAEIVPDCEVRIFGSRYNWTATDASDLDLALVGPGKLHWRTLTRLKAALEESSLPYRVDVLDWRAISPEFQKVIEQGYEVIQKSEVGTSSITFSAKRFCEIAKVLPGFAFKSTDFGNEGYPVVKIAQINPPRIEFENCQRIQEDKVNGLDRFRLHKDDILIAMTGATIGKVGRIKEDCIAYVNQRVAKIDSIEGISDRDFLYYLITDQINNSQIVELGIGSAQANLSGRDLEGLMFNVPDLPIQRRIASVLTALDEKIELNRQTNVTLEAIAQAIFKEWFVDFNFPGATGEMVESELGMIPREWRAGCFQDIINNEIGGDWGKDNPFEGGVPVISLRGTDLEQLKSFGYAPDAPVRWVKENSIEKRKVTRKDILIAGSGLGPIGRSIYCSDILQDLYAYPITYSNFCKKLRAETPAHAIYAERFLESIYINGEMRQYFTGTSIPNLDIQSLLAYKILIPNAEIIEEYYKKIGKEKFGFLFNQENIYLTQIRDALLPKLMSGEIKV